jgi:hypothetical protein
VKASPLLLVGGGFAGLAALTAGAAEILGRLGHEGLREQVYAGGLAGLFLALAGVPFAAKLARIKDAGTRFWKWWGAGVLVRLLLLLVLAVALGVMFPEGPAGALLSMAVLYLIGMFSEAAWLAKRLVGPPQSASRNG